MTQPPARPSRLDAHGFDPDDFEWVPVPRQGRADGWSDVLQKKFIETLADTGSVTAAARSVGMSRDACYKLRREPGGEGFARAWTAALATASASLVDIAFDRAINGIDEPIACGDTWRMRTRYNDRLLMFLLRAHHPERYAQDRIGRSPAEPPEPVADALVRLEPVAPDDVEHRLSDERLEQLLPTRLIGVDGNPLPELPPREPFLVSTLSTLKDFAPADEAFDPPPRRRRRRER